MKKKFILLPVVGALLYLILSSYSSGPGASGAGDLTGAHGSAGCSCHNGSATATTTVSVELDSAGFQVFKYTGGNSYTIKVTGVQTSSSLSLPYFGFQMSVVSAGTSTSRGTLTAIAGTHVGSYSSTSVIEHSTPLLATTGGGGAGTTYVLNIPWTAPAAGTGCLTIYAVINAINHNGTDDAGDKWNNIAYTIAETVAPITGTTSVCVGNTTTLATTTTCGTWASSNTTVATIGSATGVVTGAAAGTSVITYAASSGNYSTAVVTVNGAPAAISGTLSMCVGATTTLSDATGSGTWGSTSGNVSVGATSGIVTGITAGTAPVTFTLTSTGCTTVSTATVLATPTAITGATTVCVGASGFLGDGVAGGTFSSSNTAVVNNTGTAVGAGTATITYTLGTGCYVTRNETVTATPPAIGGTTTVCQGLTTSLTDGTTGGTWASSNTSVATITTGGVVTGVAGGTSVITYTVAGPGCFVTAPYTVNPTPPTISGTMAICTGASTTLTDGITGGTWLSSNTGVATIGGSSGLVAGISAGTTTISYTAPTGCITTSVFTVNPLPSAIGGALQICNSSATTLTDADGGGTWLSGNTAVASIDFSSGFLSGLSAGTSVITYTLGTGCSITAMETINPLPAAIIGLSNICVGATLTVTDATAGGTWISSNTGIATIGSASGLITGISSGLTSISYKLTGTGCLISANEFINPLPGTISGAASVCAGSGVTLTDGAGGTWSSSNTAVATVGTSSGILSGVSAGTSVITFKLSATGCYTTQLETVNALPAPVTGTASVCAGGGTTTLSDATGGGTWISSNANATIGSATGVVTGVTAGISVITYKLPTGCQITKTLTVNAVPAAIAGASAVCAGSSITLTDGTSGGAWSSSDNSTATAGTGTGVVTGVAAGPVTIIYTLSTGCSASKAITVSAVPSAIAGSFTVCAGLTTTLTDPDGAGTWISSNTAVATAGSATGVVTGVAAGTSAITYRNAGGCQVTQVATVNARAAIAGISSMCVGTTATLTNGVSGGTWSSDNATVATIGSASGIVSAHAAGTATISYTLASGCVSTSVISVISGSSPITGNLGICMGTPSPLFDAGGGTWTSSNTGIATVGFSTGIVNGVAVGTATITYSLGSGCAATAVVAVSSAPAPITGTALMCEGATTTLADATTGGTWSSSNANASVTTGGAVTGVAAGNAVISYTMGTGCYAVRTVTINPTPAAITGIMEICQGTSTPLTNGLTGGTWASSRTAIATIGASSGIMSGISAGTAIITYGMPTGCRTTGMATIDALPLAISGPAAVCAGSTITLTDAGGGTWQASNANASIDAGGVATGVTAGTTIITYTLPTSCQATRVITVNALPLAYTVTGGGSYCAGAGGMHIGLSLSATGVTYQLYNGSSLAGGAVAGTGAPLDFGAITAAGTYTVSATSSASCASDMTGSVGITINPLPLAITGSVPVCAGGTLTLADATGGGTWSAGSGAATIGSATGVVTGVSAGTSAVTYTLPTGCITTTVVRVNPLPAAITGAGSVCAGSAITLTDASGGGTWASSATGMATAGSATGVVTGIAAGSATITYTLATGCTTTIDISINPIPAAITGTATACAGAATTLADADAGGVWTSANTAIATIGTGTGAVVAVAAGTATISYTFATGCAATQVVVINPLPAAISGPATVCPGASVTLTDAATGGTWASSNDAVATIGSATGSASGVAFGAVTITYTLATGCLTTRELSVNPTPVAASISGPTHQCLGDVTYTDAATGGVWSSSNTLVVSINATTGVATGVAAGTAVITYAVTNVCSTAIATIIDSVLPGPFAGTIAGADSVCQGDTLHLLDSSPAGVWTSTNTAAATVSPAGVVTGVAAGTTTISYTVTTSCGVIAAQLDVRVKSHAECNVGVAAVPDMETIKVFPNPTAGLCNIEMPATLNGAVITVTDVLGKAVATQAVAAGNAQVLQLQLGNVAAGTYIIKVSTGDKVYRQKIEIIK